MNVKPVPPEAHLSVCRDSSCRPRAVGMVRRLAIVRNDADAHLPTGPFLRPLGTDAGRTLSPGGISLSPCEAGAAWDSQPARGQPGVSPGQRYGGYTFLNKEILRWQNGHCALCSDQRVRISKLIFLK